MYQVGVRACMRGLVLAVVLILAACSNPSGPKAQSSNLPSAAPTSIVATPTPTTAALPGPTPTAASLLTWTAPVLVDHQPPFSGNPINSVSCPSGGLCVAVEY